MATVDAANVHYRSLSRHHLEHPFVFHVGGQEYKVQYLTAELNTGMFGGNSNWRGPGCGCRLMR